MSNTEKDLMTLQYCDVMSWYIDMNNSKDHEKIGDCENERFDSQKVPRFEDW